MLLPGQKNELFQLIEKNNLDPRNFKWESVSTSRASTTYAYGEKLPVLKYNGTDFYFSIDYKRNKYFAVFSPGYKTLNEKKRELSWDLLIRYFKMWLIYLKREIKQPDLWGELLKSKLASDASDISLEPFTEPELKKISVGVDKIRAYLGSEFKFTIEEKKKVNEQLDYLVSAAKG